MPAVVEFAPKYAHTPELFALTHTAVIKLLVPFCATSMPLVLGASEKVPVLESTKACATELLGIASKNACVLMPLVYQGHLCKDV